MMWTPVGGSRCCISDALAFVRRGDVEVEGSCTYYGAVWKAFVVARRLDDSTLCSSQIKLMVKENRKQLNKPVKSREPCGLRLNKSWLLHCSDAPKRMWHQKKYAAVAWHLTYLGQWAAKQVRRHMHTRSPVPDCSSKSAEQWRDSGLFRPNKSCAQLEPQHIHLHVQSPFLATSNKFNQGAHLTR